MSEYKMRKFPNELPEHKQMVLAFYKAWFICEFRKGVTLVEREKMKSGELPDYDIKMWRHFGDKTIKNTDGKFWVDSEFYFCKRSTAIFNEDESSDNKMPYMFFQFNTSFLLKPDAVTHWCNIPENP